jgi:RNA polymerase sigma factor (sigma-70 family)
MRPRKDLAEIFTTFLSFEAYQASTWQTEPRLKRNLHKTLEQYQSAFPSPISATILATHWHQNWRPVPTDLPRLHLFAYVQEPCYWAAYRLCQRMASSSAMFLYTVPDCFQIAIAEFPKILLKFDPNRGANLGTYAEMAFSGVLKDTLKKRGEAEVCSDWALLRKISKKRFLEALASEGLAPEVIQHYSLAWMCLRELWVPEPQQQRLSAPPATIWTAIAAAYRQVKPLDGPEVSPTQLEQWLQKAGRMVRVYLYPQPSSLNERVPGMEGREKLDTLASNEDDSLLTQVIVQEEDRSRHQDYSQMQQALQAALQGLKPDWQNALYLYYQENQTQSQIAQRLQCSQPSVARYLIKARAALLTALTQWATAKLNSPPTPDRIKVQSEALEEWLQLRYGQLEGRST